MSRTKDTQVEDARGIATTVTHRAPPARNRGTGPALSLLPAVVGADQRSDPKPIVSDTVLSSSRFLVVSPVATKAQSSPPGATHNFIRSKRREPQAPPPLPRPKPTSLWPAPGSSESPQGDKASAGHSRVPAPASLGGVSKNFDTKGHGISMDTVSAFLPPSLLPLEHHVMETSPVVPVGDDPAEWRRVGPRSYVKQLFPSMKPTGRQEAVLLAELYDKIAVSFEEASVATPLPEIVQEFQKLHSACMFELVRQVSVHCVERGVLLKRVWEGYDSLLLKLGEAHREQLQQSRNDSSRVVAALRSELEKVLGLLAQARQELAEKEAMIQRGESDVVMDLKAVIDNLRSESTVVAQKHGALQAELARISQEWSSCKTQMQALQAALADKATEYQDAMQEWDSMKEVTRDLNEELAHLRESISESTGRATSVEYVEKGAQTENASTGPDSLLYAGLAEPDSEEHAGDSDAHACATRKRWHAHKPIYTAGFPMETVLKAIQRVYQEMIHADAGDVVKGPAPSLNHFMELWFLHNYGEVMHEEAKQKFALTIRKFKDTNLYCQTFGRLWGLFDPLDEATCQFYLAMLAPIINAHTNSHNVIPLEHTGGYMVNLRLLVEVARKQFVGLLDPKALTALLARITATAEAYGPLGHKFVEQEVFMSIMRQERQAMMDRLATTLRRLFRAGDVNGDGILDMGEFGLLVRYVNDSTPPETIERMYNDAKSPEGGVLTADDFANICFQYGLVTDVPKARLVMNQVSILEDQPLADVFSSLALQWKLKEETFKAKLSSITDSGVRTALNHRVKMVNKDPLSRLGLTAHRRTRGQGAFSGNPSTRLDSLPVSPLVAKAASNAVNSSLHDGTLPRKRLTATDRPRTMQDAHVLMSPIRAESTRSPTWGSGFGAAFGDSLGGPAWGGERALDKLSALQSRPSTAVLPLGPAANLIVDHSSAVDASKNFDAKGHGISMDTVPAFLPPSLLPPEHRITTTASSIPAGEDPEEWRRVGPRSYVKQLFPSMKPTGRQEAVLLAELYDKLSESFEEASVTAPLPEIVQEFQKVHSACMFELVRQVSVHCLERGVLLKRVWEGYDSLFLKLGVAHREQLQQCKNESGRVLAALQSELEKVLVLLSQARQEGKDKDAIIEKGESQLLVDLRKSLEEMTAKQQATEAELHEARVERAQAEQGWALCKDRADASAKALEELQAKYQLAMQEWATLQEAHKEMQAQLKRVHASMALDSSGFGGAHISSTEVREIGVQTDEDAVDASRGASVLDGDDGATLSDSMGRVSKKRKAPRSANVACWALETTLKAIQKIYIDKIKADEADDIRSHPRQDFIEYVSDWFLNNYGKAEREARRKCANTLKKYQSTNLYCQTFGRLWGVFDPLDEATCQFYLAVLSPVLDVRGERDHVIPLSQSSGFMVNLRILLDVARKHFAGLLEQKQLSSLLARITTTAEAYGPLGHKFVEQEVFMSIMRQERQAMMDRLTTTLRRLFVAGDVNGDGMLDMGEFGLLVRYVNNATPHETIEDMYHDAQTNDIGVLSPDDFASVCFNYGLLTADGVKGRLLVSQVGDLEDRSLADMFSDLASSWRANAAEFTSRVSGVADAGVRATLGQRMRKVDAMLSECTDLEATNLAVQLTTDEILRLS